jgi:glycine/D-amino acid oxidase-like deaminating enzyme
MLSFWERESFTSIDYVIIGGGIVGLSTACSIKELEPNARVLVLERGLFPSGASTKNAGFACFGSITELLADWQQMGKDKALQLVQYRYEGLKKLRTRLGDESIGYLPQGGFELIRENEQYALSKIDEVNDWLRPYFQQDIFFEDRSLVGKFGFPSTIESIIVNPLEAQIDTGKMMRSLIGYAQSLGVGMLTGAQVEQWKEQSDAVQIRIKNPVHSDVITIQAAKVAICTNAFSKSLLPDIDLQPGRGLVLITKPLAHVPFRGVFHMEEGYFYFRDVGNRVLLGGGRNLDFDGETSTNFEVNLSILAELQRLLSEQILPSQTAEIDMVWTGIMAFGQDKQPILQRISPRIAAGIRLGGMGVAIGSEMGHQLAALLQDG